MSTEINGVRCSECLFAVSYWDMHCTFPIVGAILANRNIIERRVQQLRAVYDNSSVEQKSIAVTCFIEYDDKCLSCVHREMFDGLRMLNSWHASLHPDCPNVTHTDRYASVMFRKKLTKASYRVHGHIAPHAVVSLPRYIMSRQLGL